MTTLDLTKDSFAQTLEENDIVLVDWWASWCGPCRSFAPICQKAATAHPDIVFAQSGALPKPALEQVISAIRDLDMSEVRATLTADSEMAR